MKIVQSEFVTSVADAKNLISDGKKQIAFVGRSNVGKSSLLNMLVNRTKLAKTSSTPGLTKLVNYFIINNSFYFVDLPGYGFAKASKSEARNWQKLIEPYLVNNENLACVCVLVDIRHKPSELDELMINYLNYYNIPFIIVATKADKLSKSQVKPMCQQLATHLKVGVGNIYPTSSDTRFGKDELLIKLSQFLNHENFD